MVPQDTWGKRQKRSPVKSQRLNQHGNSQRLWTPALALWLGHIPELTEPLESEQEGGGGSPPQTAGCQGHCAVGQGTHSL